MRDHKSGDQLLRRPKDLRAGYGGITGLDHLPEDAFVCVQELGL